MYQNQNVYNPITKYLEIFQKIVIRNANTEILQEIDFN